ncbi:soluble guanylate cyclase [Salpingoeca rosetta]|uniref:guanylate cyclase n=1 Tax=Salpingoeca rosetta (strain ATCC 50818 / BSB-021) TaxID=946362 RepID=F2UQW4_SALR5|nr:soluble guanylate cyclase [Salpingoeca rosetta]EGD80019.1 soluble guanylate cyclase [Salpingoeca rosetta]|eukprot:XP_004988344.1 soluble guanylate cyclase [Salpingoeca rosetta]
MYGFITTATLEWIESLDDGERLLKELYAELGEDPKNNFYKKYSDEYTQTVVQAAAKVTGKTAEQVIAGMGFIQINNFAAQGYTPLVQALGRTFYECLQHVDALHRNLVNAYPDMQAPSFRPERHDDGLVLLHYYSSRPGLWPYAINLLRQVARIVYNVEFEYEHYQKKHEGKDHDIFKLYLPPEAFGTEADLDAVARARQFSKLSADTGLFDELFPWHVQIDRKMRVVSMGSSLQTRFQDQKLDSLTFHDVFKLTQPNVPQKTFTTFMQFDHDAFVAIARDEQYHMKKEQKHMAKLRARAAEHGWDDDDDALLQRTVSCSSVEGESFISVATDYLYIKGEMIYISKTDTILFAGVPQFSKPEEMYLRGLSLADIPIHSNGREILFSTAHQAATVSIAAELEQTTSDLSRAQQEVTHEKHRVQELLHSILPKQVAQCLSDGQIPEAERYQSVTILFSDVPAFPRIVGSVKPAKVMQFLNDLFSRFDRLCEKYDVYKVETIGDSYMVASGIPEYVPDHADRMAQLAVEMMKEASNVVSPIDGTPITIRIGMHSGPIMAGVIGKTRPRYCLFGDTVNVASRMESTSRPGRIQYSASTMSELHAVDSKVTWKSRGDIPVKGKGNMETFFLTGYGQEDPSLAPTEADFDTSMFTAAKKKSQRPSMPAPAASSSSSSALGGVDMQTLLQLFATMQGGSMSCPHSFSGQHHHQHHQHRHRHHQRFSYDSGVCPVNHHSPHHHGHYHHQHQHQHHRGSFVDDTYEPSSFYDVRLVVSSHRDGGGRSTSTTTTSTAGSRGHEGSSGKDGTSATTSGGGYSLMNLMCAFPMRSQASSSGSGSSSHGATLAGVGDTNTVEDLVETLQLSNSTADDDEVHVRVYADANHTRRIMGSTTIGQLVRCRLVKPTRAMPHNRDVEEEETSSSSSSDGDGDGDGSHVHHTAVDDGTHARPVITLYCVQGQ